MLWKCFTSKHWMNWNNWNLVSSKTQEGTLRNSNWIESAIIIRKINGKLQSLLKSLLINFYNKIASTKKVSTLKDPTNTDDSNFKLGWQSSKYFIGLFRLPGAVTKINIICAALDSPNYKGDIIEDFEPDNQALASILKKFFRDLEIPVLSKLKENGDIDIIGMDIIIFTFFRHL